MKKHKNLLKLIFIIIVTFMILYLGSTFLMKDKSGAWCLLTFGEFKSNISCEYGKWDVEKCGQAVTKKICKGGIFDFKEIEKRIKCPDQWIKDRSFRLYDSNFESEYFIIKGKKTSKSEIEPERLKWIKENCEDRIREIS